MDSDEAMKPRTEMFVSGDKTYRIVWDTKRVQTKELGSIAGWMQASGYGRVASLRVPYALEIQHAFSSDLTRVGVPVAPPISRGVRIGLYCSDKVGNPRALTENHGDLAALFLTRDREQIVEQLVFNEKFSDLVAESLAAAISELSARHKALEANDKLDADKKAKKLERCSAHLASLEALSSDPIRIVQLHRHAFPLPPLGDTVSLKVVPVVIVNKPKVDAKFQYDEPLVICLSAEGP
jgi:hypothetical protein